MYDRSDRYSIDLNSTKLELVFLLKLFEKCGLIEIDPNLVIPEVREKPLWAELVRTLAGSIGCSVGAYLCLKSLSISIAMGLGYFAADCMLLGLKARAKRKQS